MSIIELSPNYGETYLTLAKRQSGKLVEYLSKAFSVVGFGDRLNIRTRMTPPTSNLDSTANSEYICVSSGDWVAVSGGIAQSDSNVVLLEAKSPFAKVRLDFSTTVSCASLFSIGGCDVLLVGLISGDIEVFNIISATEIKTVYKLGLPMTTYPIAFSEASQDTFQVALSCGKCMLDCDALAVLSGNSAVSPIIVDLLQNGVVSVAAHSNKEHGYKNRFVASLNSNSVRVTDLSNHKYLDVSIRQDIVTAEQQLIKIFWDAKYGHIFIVSKEGKVADLAWNNGLTGVATLPTNNSVGSGKQSISQSWAQFNNGDSRQNNTISPKFVDIKHEMLATVVINGNNTELLVYRVVHAHQSVANGSGNNVSISNQTSHFRMERKIPILNEKSLDTVVGVTIVCHNKVAVVVFNSDIQLRYRIVLNDI